MAIALALHSLLCFSFVPNGGRLYYTTRSQPPLLSDMVCEVYSARPEDRAFLARALPSLVSTPVSGALFTRDGLELGWC